jgi:hypothetical protein
MKFSTILLLLLTSTNLLGQTANVRLQGDSLIITDGGIASDPYKFDRDPMSHLKTKVKLPKLTIEASPVPNRHVDNQVDTVFAIRYGSDLFSIYKGGDGENFLLNSKVHTDRFSTKHGVKIGMTKLQIMACFKEYSIRSIPKYLVLENAEMTEYLVFEFDNSNLIRVEFIGYFD